MFNFHFLFKPSQLSVTITFTILLTLITVLNSCTQEQQNKFSRNIQNWTGTNGVLDVMSDGKIMYRIIHIDKLSTAISTSQGSIPRPYRFGYGVFDLNQNYIKDNDEKKMYFEFSDYSTPYLFYENPLAISKDKS